MFPLVVLRFVEYLVSRRSPEWLQLLLQKFIEIVNELEEQRELATNRLTELEKLQRDHTEALKTIENLKMDVSHTGFHSLEVW